MLTTLASDGNLRIEMTVATHQSHYDEIAKAHGHASDDCHNFCHSPLWYTSGNDCDFSFHSVVR